MPVQPVSEDVYIVLATHNGERFLAQQLDSIRNQTFQDWCLLISDDASTDQTKQLIAEAVEADPRVCLLDGQNRGPVGACANFGVLLEAAFSAGAQLCFIADQDDIWAPRKMEMQLRRFPQSGLECQPMLVHSDLQLVNETGQPIGESFFGYRDIEPLPERPLHQLLSLNFVTGCSVCVNRRLLELATPIPEGALMHDWWLALVAAATGVIDYIADPIVDYRQHEDNVIGAGGERAAITRVAQWRANWAKGEREFRGTFGQVRQLLDRLIEQDKLDRDIESVLRNYLRLPSLGVVARIRAASVLGLRQGKGLLRCIFYMRLLFAGSGAPARVSQE